MALLIRAARRNAPPCRLSSPKAPGMNRRSRCCRRISGRVRFFGDSNGPRKDLRGERGAFVADEDITSLAAFRTSARAKTFPTTAPPKRIRTSGRDLPQKEQVVHGAAIVVVSAVSSFFAEVSTPLSEGAGTSSVLELDVSVVGDAVSGRRVRVCRSSSAGNLATSVFQSGSPNCRATISRQSLCESRTLRFPRAS